MHWLKSNTCISRNLAPLQPHILPSTSTRCMASLGTPATHKSVDTAKDKLISLVKEKRFKSNKMVRGVVEEAQVAVESFGGPIDYNLLAGKWRLVYTTASDVIPILRAETLSLPTLFGPFSPLQVGNIYQSFTAPDENGQGVIENIIELGLTGWTESKGLVITVKAQYEPQSARSILLWFEEAKVDEIKISEGLESIIAPALLPRGPIQQALLMFLKELKIVIPFSSARQTAVSLQSLLFPSPGTGERRNTASSGGAYQLTYVDEQMLIGRASTLGGSFIFVRSDANGSKGHQIHEEL